MLIALLVGPAPALPPRPIFARILRLLRPQTGLKGVSQGALDNQPDSIHLRRRSFEWQNQAALHRLTGPLLARSFSEVGDFSVAEMPELKVRLLLKRANSTYACVCEHPHLGTWLDLVACYQDGSIATFSTARDSGVEQRPEDLTVYAPDLSADMLYTRMLQERPQQSLVNVDAKNVVRLFQDAYQQQTGWRKKHDAAGPDVAKGVA